MLTRQRATAVLTSETLTLIPSECDDDDDDINNNDNKVNEDKVDDDDDDDDHNNNDDDDDDHNNNDDDDENRRWTEKIFGASDGGTSTAQKLELESSDDDEYYAAREAEEAAEAAKPEAVIPISSRGGRKLLPGLPPLAPTDAPESVQESARHTRRLEYQKQYREKLKGGKCDPRIELTGNDSPTLRTMSEVKNCRLEKDQVFASKESLLLRVKEEANLRGITIHTPKSDATKFVAYSEEVLDFFVQATISMRKACTVKHAIVRHGDVDMSWNGVIPGLEIHPILKAKEEGICSSMD
jgi:hypothetical protein